MNNVSQTFVGETPNSLVVGNESEIENPNHPANHPHFPTSEEEAEKMMLNAFDNDPEKIRKAAQKSFDKMMSLAKQLEVGKDKPDNVVVLNTSSSVVRQEDVIETKKEEKTKEEKSEVVVKQIEQTIKQTVLPPPNYLETPEGLYYWSPDVWGGRPLHGVPDRVIEREGRPVLIVFIIVAPAYGRNRNGRVVSLPEGARLIVHAGVAWGPIIGLAKGPEGRPVIWAAPTTVDKLTGKIRIAEPGDKLHYFETGDGGKEYGLSIMYDPDPKDSSKPRLISLETLRGVSE